MSDEYEFEVPSMSISLESIPTHKSHSFVPSENIIKMVKIEIIHN